MTCLEEAEEDHKVVVDLEEVEDSTEVLEVAEEEDPLTTGAPEINNKRSR